MHLEEKHPLDAWFEEHGLANAMRFHFFQSAGMVDGGILRWDAGEASHPNRWDGLGDVPFPQHPK